MPEYIICYDICDPRRLQRIHRCLQKRALALQYSVFLLQADPRAIAPLMDELAAMIDEKTDDLRCYRLPARGFRARLGAAVLPEGIHFTAFPASLHPLLKDEHKAGSRTPSPKEETAQDHPTAVTAQAHAPAPPAQGKRRPAKPRPLRRRGVYRL